MTAESGHRKSHIQNSKFQTNSKSQTWNLKPGTRAKARCDLELGTWNAGVERFALYTRISSKCSSFL